MENDNYKPNRYTRRHPAALARVVAAAILRSPLIVTPAMYATYNEVRAELDNHAQEDRAETIIRENGPGCLFKLRNLWPHVATYHIDIALQKGAKLDAKDADGNIPLHFAAGYGKAEIIPKLVAQDMAPNAKNNAGETPFHWAVKHENAEVIPVLARNHKDVNIPDNDGNTPLHLAKKEKTVNAILALENPQANRDAKNNDKDTPLHLRVLEKNASEEENTKVICALIEAGANVKAKNAKGLTPLYYAIKHKHLHIAELLKTADAK